MAYIRPGPYYQPVRPSFRLHRGLVFGLIMVAALGAFELFNLSTTEYALYTVLGNASILGIAWASVLAIAFCCIDFAGLARLFTPEQGRDEPKEVWYLFGAWFLGASVNAVMTWWAITNILVGRPLGNELVSREQLLTWVPIFIAALVWLTRVLIIGTFGVAGERLFTLGNRPSTGLGLLSRSQPRTPFQRPAPSPPGQPRFQSQPQPQRPEPTYEPVEEERPQPSPFGATRPPFRRQQPTYTYASRVSAPPGASYGFTTSARDAGAGWRAVSSYYYTRPAYIEAPRRPGEGDRSMEA